MTMDIDEFGCGSLKDGMREFLEARNPFTGESIGAIPRTPSQSLNQMVQRAQDTQRVWAQTSWESRRQAMLLLRERVVDNMRRIVETISQSTSKPYVEALSAEVWGTLETLRWCVDSVPRLMGRKHLWMGRYWTILRQSTVQLRPLGVVGIISPWNFPFSIPMGQVLPAVMAGNAVILKPSELTPLVGLLIQELFDGAGFPPGLVQVVQGGKEVGEALVDSGVQKILFTGSTAVGHQVAARAAGRGIPVSLELGGKDAMIVCADAHLEKAVRGALWGAFSNCGQVCASVERLFVHESLYERFVERLKNKMMKLKVGPPEDFCDVGTLISPAQSDKVKRALETARQEGAEIFQVDHHLQRPQPTLVLKVKPSMAIAQSETFGPILPIMAFQSDEAVVKEVNQNAYGLSASVWSESLAHARRIADDLHVGSVTINGSAYTHALPMTPWGGVKNSGWGWSHGVWGLHEVTRIHHVHTNFNKGNVTEFWWFGYTQQLFELLVDLTVQFTRPGKWAWLAALFPFFAAKRQKKY